MAEYRPPTDQSDCSYCCSHTISSIIRITLFLQSLGHSSSLIACIALYYDPSLFLMRLSYQNVIFTQADVYINSTNTNLNLKQGQLSKLLLNACGDNLQKECSEYAPLKPGKVAVTDTKNLKCSHIFHVALPEYQTANSERVSFRL